MEHQEKNNKNEKIKNFSISSKVSFTLNDLVYFNKKQNKILSLLNTSLESKTNALHFSERNIIDTCKKIVYLTNKKKVSGKLKQLNLDDKIEELLEKNNMLFNHIAKIRCASKLDSQSYIKSCEEFEDFKKVTYSITNKDNVLYFVKNMISRELIEQALLMIVFSLLILFLNY